MVSFQDLLDYFLAPKKTGYDIPKTLTYALVLVVAAYLLFKALRKIGVKIDRRLVISVIPYIVLGSTVRVLEDQGSLSSYLFVTPGIYFLIAGVFISVLLLSILLERKKGVAYFKPTFVVGVVLMAVAIANLGPVTNPIGIAYVFLFFIPWVGAFYLLKRFGLANRIAACVQMFDANVTFVALQFFGSSAGNMGFYEQHVVPTFIINIFGPASFIITKIIVVGAALFLIDRFTEDKQFANYLKLIIGILGMATGTRDILALTTLY
jgi:uncharacterized membrane protein